MLPGFPAQRFVVVAETPVDLPKGAEYEVAVISDDGVRLWIDDKLAIDNWKQHESVIDRADLKPGKHRLRVDYYQVDGWVELKVEIRRKVP